MDEIQKITSFQRKIKVNIEKGTLEGARKTWWLAVNGRLALGTTAGLKAGAKVSSIKKACAVHQKIRARAVEIQRG